jgi:hypothetical protein
MNLASHFELEHDSAMATEIGVEGAVVQQNYLFEVQQDLGYPSCLKCQQCYHETGPDQLMPLLRSTAAVELE